MSYPRATLPAMTTSVVLVALLALCLGVLAGWLLGRRAGHGQLGEVLATAAGEALARNTETLARVAESSRAHAAAAEAESGARREAAISHLVSPVRDGLDRLASQLAQLDADRARTQATLSEQLAGVVRSAADLRRETSSLVTALRAPHVRGQWGEMQLRRTVEAAGMLRHVDFDLQVSSEVDGRTLRPDMVVRLVGGKQVVVDAKVAFSAYLEAMEARDDSARDERLRAHARQLRAHIDALAGREYQLRFSPTPELVVCFVPADGILDAALQADPSLQEHGFERGIVLATPATLVALLRTIAYTWRQDALATNARQVHELARDLYQRLGTLGAHLDKLGRGLTTASEQYNKTVACLEARVLVSARRLRDLEVVDSADPTTELITPAQVAVSTRTIDAPEFLATT